MSRFFLKQIPVLVIAGLLVSAATASAVPDRVEVDTEQISLGDLLVGLEGPAARTRVGYAPYPGHHRWVSRKEILGTIERLGLDPSRWNIPDRVLIVRGSRTVSELQVREAIEDFVERQFPGLRIQIEEIEMPQEVVLPLGDVEIRINDRNPPAHLRGSTLRLDFYVDGSVKGSQWARVTATAVGEVAVLKRSLDYGETLTASAVALEKRELKVLDDYFASLDLVLGAVARKKLTVGEIVQRRDIREALMVKRGDVVTLLAKGPRFTLSTSARARDNGSRGDSITVENLDSRQVVQARVVDAGVVETLVSGSER